MSLVKLLDNICAVVDYHWRDELLDYQVQHDDGNTAGCDTHVFNHLVGLSNFVNNTQHSASHYLREDDPVPTVVLCRGCKRSEGECSVHPCPDVIADREALIAQHGFADVTSVILEEITDEDNPQASP